VIYAGSDDGSLHMTRDGGKTWIDIAKNLTGFPRGGVVSEVVPSRYDAARVYVTVDGHYENDFEPYIWESDDFGATFRSINGNLKGTNVRTLTEDTRNPDVLYIGTESGIFLTLDRAKSWKRPQGESADGARRRDHDHAARQFTARRDARPRALDPRSPRADSGIFCGAGVGERRALAPSRPLRCSGRRRTIATTSSGATISSPGESAGRRAPRRVFEAHRA
jgi:hypothetical protein